MSIRNTQKSNLQENRNLKYGFVLKYYRRWHDLKKTAVLFEYFAQSCSKISFQQTNWRICICCWRSGIVWSKKKLLRKKAKMLIFQRKAVYWHSRISRCHWLYCIFTVFKKYSNPSLKELSLLSANFTSPMNKLKLCSYMF